MVEKDVTINDAWNMVDLMRVVINNDNYTPTPDVTYMLCEIILHIADNKPYVEYATRELQNVLDYIREYNSSKNITKKTEREWEIKRRIVVAIEKYSEGSLSGEWLSYATDTADIDDLL